MAAVLPDAVLEDVLPLSGETCRATVHLDTLEGSYGCYRVDDGGGIEWVQSTTMVAASPDALGIDGVLLDMTPAGLFIAHGQELTPLDDIAAETLDGARGLDDQVSAIQRAVDAHQGVFTGPPAWAVVAGAILVVGVVFAFWRRARRRKRRVD